MDDQEAIELRDQLIKRYSVQEVSLVVRPDIFFKFRVIGSNNFTTAITLQIAAIIRTHHGKILLQELAELPTRVDFIEYKTSHTASHNGSVVILHNATELQAAGMARFEDKFGKPRRGGFLPEMTLAHELFHVGQLQQADFFEPYCNWFCSITGGPSKSAFEIGAVKYTNQIRIDKHLGYVRSYLGGGGVLGSSVIENKKIDSYKEANARRRK